MSQASQPTLVVTRFELKHWWLAPLLHIWFRRVNREMGLPKRSLQQSLLLRESRRRYVTLSIWSEPHDMVKSAVPRHVDAVRRSRRWCKAIWTTQWHLTRVSRSAHSWPESGLDWWDVARSAGVDHGWAGAGTSCDGHPVNSWRQPPMRPRQSAVALPGDQAFDRSELEPDGAT
jgi:hypothetical protein